MTSPQAAFQQAHVSLSGQRCSASLVQSENDGVEKWQRYYTRPRFPLLKIRVRRPDLNIHSFIIYAKPISEQSVPVALMALPLISSSDFVTDSCGWHWHLHYIIYSLLAWQTTMIFWKFWWKSPVRSTRTSHQNPDADQVLVQHRYCGISNAIRSMVNSFTHDS